MNIKNLKFGKTDKLYNRGGVFVSVISKTAQII